MTDERRLSTTAPIKNGVVRYLRTSAALRTGLKGGIHQRLSPRRVRYPFAHYGAVSAPYMNDWGSDGNAGVREIHALIDISIFSTSQVEAENLDQRIDGLFSSAFAKEALDALVVGQTVTYCARVGDLPTGPERDDEGRRIVQVGGTYEIWTVQPIPLT